MWLDQMIHICAYIRHTFSCNIASAASCLTNCAVAVHKHTDADISTRLLYLFNFCTCEITSTDG